MLGQAVCVRVFARVSRVSTSQGAHPRSEGAKGASMRDADTRKRMQMHAHANTRTEEHDHDHHHGDCR